jgi:hypothetical protein
MSECTRREITHIPTERVRSMTQVEIEEARAKIASLREQAKSERNSAQYADSRQAYREDIESAARLDRKATEIELQIAEALRSIQQGNPQ